jgi:hypothetical protein
MTEIQIQIPLRSFLEQFAADEHPPDLRRACADLKQLGIPPEPSR